MDLIETNKFIYLILELAGKRNLLKHCQSNPGDTKCLIKQLVEAVDYLHSRNIVHRDLKIENIMVDSRGKLKVIDFGFSIHLDPQKKLSRCLGTPLYLAPEMVEKELYSPFKVDVWALGILIYCLLTGRFPFNKIPKD